MVNILITSAGRRVSLINYFKKELAKFYPNGKTLTTDLNPSISSACRSSDLGIKIGRIKDPNYIDDLLSICLDKNVKAIIPTIDPELKLLSKNQAFFESKGIAIVISDPHFIDVCRDKRKTNSFFLQRNFLIPKTIDRDNPQFPLFIKPVDGSSSKNLFFIDSKDKLSPYLINTQDLMWMEYLDPNDHCEYTVDLYYNKSSKLKCVVPRIRITVRGGESNKGITDKNQHIIEFIKKNLSKINGARGCLTLQIFLNMTNGNIYGIEINPRFGGGYPLSYLAGANYPEWIIREYLLGEKIDWYEDWEDKLLLLRHDNEMVIHDFEYNP